MTGHVDIGTIAEGGMWTVIGALLYLLIRILQYAF